MGYRKIAEILIPAKHEITILIPCKVKGLKEWLAKVPDKAIFTRVNCETGKCVMAFDEATLDRKPRRKRSDAGTKRGSKPNGKMRAMVDATNPQPSPPGGQDGVSEGQGVVNPTPARKRGRKGKSESPTPTNRNCVGCTEQEECKKDGVEALDCWNIKAQKAELDFKK